MDLSDKVVVVTGARRGLGAGISKLALEYGAKVATCSTKPTGLGEGPHRLEQCFDVADSGRMKSFAEEVAERFGQVDLWVNNAGVLGPVGPMRDASSEEFGRALQVNIMGVVHGSQAYAKHCRVFGKQGVLLNVSSGAGRKPYTGWSAYCSTKAAVDMCSRVLAVEEGPGLRVHAVAPGVVDSDMQAVVRQASVEDFPQVDKFHKLHEDKQLSTPEYAGGQLLRLAFDPLWFSEEICVDVREMADRIG